MGKTKLIKGKSGAYGLSSDDGATVDVLPPEARLIKGKSGAYGVTSDGGLTVDVLSDFDETTLDSAMIFSPTPEKKNVVGTSSSSDGSLLSPSQKGDGILPEVPQVPATNGKPVIDVFEQKKTLFPDLYNKVKDGYGYAAGVSDLPETAKPVFLRAGEVWETKPKDYINPLVVGDIEAERKGAELFATKVVARFDRSTGNYFDETGQPKTKFEEGQVVSGMPTDATMTTGQTYKSGYAQLVNGEWREVSPPDPSFSIKDNDLDNVVVQGYAKNKSLEGTPSGEDPYNKAVSMMRKSEAAITDEEFEAATKMVIEGKDDPVYTALESNKLAEGGKKLAPFLAIHKEILPEYRKILKDHPTYNASQQGSYNALNEAVTKTYELDKEVWEPMNGDVNNYVNSTEYFDMAEKANPKPYRDVIGKMEVIKAAHDKETDPKKKAEYVSKYNTYAVEAKAMEAEQQKVMEYFKQPNVKLLIDRAEKHRKGLGVQSYIGKLFPKREANEETIFQKDHEQLSMIERILSFPHAVINGLGGGVNEMLDFLDETADTLTGADADSHMLRQRMNDTESAKLAANNHIQATDNAVGDFVLEFAEMVGSVAPAFATGGAGVVSKAGMAGYFGMTTAQATQKEYYEKGIDSKTTQLAATVNGSLMALAAWGFGLSDKLLKPQGNVFKPSFSTTQMMLNPETRKAGSELFMTELKSFNGGQLLKGIPANVWSAAKLRAAEEVHVYINDVVNKVKGTDLNTESGGAGDFLHMVGSFALLHGLTSMASKKSLTDADKMALVNDVATTNMKATMDALEGLKRVKGADKNTIRKMEETLTTFAGLKFPKGTTKEQKTLLFLEVEQKKAFEEAVKESEFPEYYKDKVKESDERIKEILDNPKGATGKVKKATEPIVEEIKAAANDPFKVRGISLMTPEELAASRRETTTVEAKDATVDTKDSKATVILPESNKPVETTTVGGKGESATEKKSGTSVILPESNVPRNTIEKTPIGEMQRAGDELKGVNSGESKGGMKDRNPVNVDNFGDGSRLYRGSNNGSTEGFNALDADGASGYGDVAVSEVQPGAKVLKLITGDSENYKENESGINEFYKIVGEDMRAIGSEWQDGDALADITTRLWGNKKALEKLKKAGIGIVIGETIDGPATVIINAKSVKPVTTNETLQNSKAETVSSKTGKEDLPAESESVVEGGSEIGEPKLTNDTPTNPTKPVQPDAVKPEVKGTEKPAPKGSEPNSGGGAERAVPVDGVETPKAATRKEAFASEHGVSFDDISKGVDELTAQGITNRQINVLDDVLRRAGVKSDYDRKAYGDYVKIKLEETLPSKLPNKNDRYEVRDGFNGEIAILPIEQKIKPSENTTKGRQASLAKNVSTDEMRPAMQGVYHDAENKVMVVTDAHRMVWVDEPAIKESRIVNPKTGETIDARFPDYKVVIPQDNPIKVNNLPINDLINQTAGIDRANRFVTKEVLAVIKIGENEYAFDAKLFNGVVSTLAENGAKTVDISFSTPNRAIVFSSKENPKVHGLLMPMLLDSAEMPYKIIHQRELTKAEKQDAIQIEISSLAKGLSREQKAVKDAVAELRNAKNGKESRSAEFDIEYHGKRAKEIEEQIESKKSDLAAVDNPIQEKQDLETVKTSINNGEIKSEQAAEYVTKPTKRTRKAKQSIEDIESKAESENEAELKEVIEQADELINGNEAIIKKIKTLQKEYADFLKKHKKHIDKKGAKASMPDDVRQEALRMIKEMNSLQYATNDAFETLSKERKEKSRQETEKINADFEAKQAELQKEFGFTDAEMMEATVEQKIEFKTPLTKAEIAYANDNLFVPKGFEYGKNGLVEMKNAEKQKETVGNDSAGKDNLAEPGNPKQEGSGGKSEQAQTVKFEHPTGETPTGKVIGEEDGLLIVQDKNGIKYRVAEKQILEKDGAKVRDATPRTPEEVKTAKTEAKKLANKIRKVADKIGNAKLGGDGAAMSDISALPRKLIQLSLKGAAEIIEAGGSVADAVAHFVEKAKAYLDKEGVFYTNKSLKKSSEEYFKSNGMMEADKDTTIKQDIKATTQTGKVTGEPITMSQKQALKNQIKDVGRGFRIGRAQGNKEGKVTEQQKQKAINDGIESAKGKLKDIIEIAKERGVFDGEVGGKVLAKMAKDLLGIKTERQAEKFAAKLDKTLDNIEYDKDLQTAESYRAAVAKAAKSKSRQLSASTKGVIAEFLRLKPEDVTDVREYTDKAKAMLTVARGVKAKADAFGATTSNEVYEISNEEILNYVEYEHKVSEARAEAAFKESYKDLVDAGILDPKTMSFEEMKEVVDAIEGTDVDAAQVAAEKMAANENKLAALRKVVDYNRMGLDDYETVNPNLTKQQTTILKALRGIDTADLPAQLLVKLNSAINEVAVNNNFVGSGEIALLHTVQQNLPEIKAILKKAGMAKLGEINNLTASLSSMQLMHEFITKNTRVAAEVQRLSGIFDIFSGHAKAQDVQMKAVNEYQAIKKKMGRSIDTAINRFRRGILADVANSYGGTEKETKAEFDRRKNWIKVSAERLKASEDKTEQQTGEIYQKAYDELLEGSENYADVLAKSDRLNSNNGTLVEFWRNKFSEREDLTREDAELYNNQVWDGQENYTSTKMKGLKGQVSSISKGEEDLMRDSFISKSIKNKAAGTKTKKTSSANPSKGMALDLDFDKVQAKRFYETNYDVETGKHIAMARLFFATEGTSEVFGGSKNRGIVKDAVSKSITAQKGIMPEEDALYKAVGKVANVLNAKGVRIALGSISQVAKQVIGVFANTIPNMGKDVALLPKATVMFQRQRAGANELMANFGIGIRGRKAAAGTNKEIDIATGGEAHITPAAEVLGRVNSTASALTDGIMYTLSSADAGVAKTTWLAYYLKSLKEQGTDISNMDLSAEAKAPNQKAAAYAEQMVSRTQTPSDPSALGNLYKDKRAAARLLKNLYMEFSTFSINQRARMTNDAQKILFGGDKTEAALSLSGSMAEAVVFNMVKVMVIGAAVKAGVNAVSTAFGFRDEDDENYDKNKEHLTLKVGEKELNVNAKTKKVVANSLSDFFFSGMGSATQNTLNAGANWLYNNSVEEYTKNGERVENARLFYVPSAEGKTNYGTLSPVIDQFKELKDNAKYLDGETEKIVAAGPEGVIKETAKLTEAELNAHRMSALINFFALAGLSDAELTHANSQFKQVMDRKMADRYGKEKGVVIDKVAKDPETEATKLVKERSAAIKAAAEIQREGKKFDSATLKDLERFNVNQKEIDGIAKEPVLSPKEKAFKNATVDRKIARWESMTEKERAEMAPLISEESIKTFMEKFANTSAVKDAIDSSKEKVTIPNNPTLADFQKVFKNKSRAALEHMRYYAGQKIKPEPEPEEQ